MQDTRPAWRRWLSRLVPWLISAVVVAILATRYSPQKMLDYLQRGDGLTIALWALCATVLSLLMMATADWILFRSALGSIPWKSVVRGRGGMSLVTAVSYGVGQGSYGLWLARVSGARVSKTVGVLAYVMLSDLTVVCVLGAVALWFRPDVQAVSQGQDYLIWVKRLAPLVAAGLLVLGFWGSRILPRIVRAQRLGGLIEPWSEVSPWRFVQSLVFRMGNILATMTMTWVAARAFGIDAPLAAFLSFLPIIFLVNALPVNVGPFGAVQFAWVHFFAAYGEEEQIIAFQVLYSMLLTIGWALRGLPFVASVAREIEEGSRDEKSGQRDLEQNEPASRA
jgi:hypothetical protein